MATGSEKVRLLPPEAAAVAQEEEGRRGVLRSVVEQP